MRRSRWRRTRLASDTLVAQANYPVPIVPDGTVGAVVIILMNFGEAPHDAVQYINEANYGNTVPSD